MKYKVLLKSINSRVSDGQEFDSFEEAMTFASDADKENLWRVSVLEKDNDETSIYTGSGEEIVSFRNVR